MIAFFNLRFIEMFNTLLNITDAVLLVAGLCVIFSILHSQRRDIADGRRLIKMLAQLSVLMEADSRKNRHAIKNMASTLGMKQIAEEMQRAIDEDATVLDQPGTLVGKIVSLATDPEEAIADAS